MRINKLTICNISSYAGICEFDFTVSNDHNIVLIGGQNGTGKTSLFIALKLALYGHLCFNYQSNNNQYFSRIKEMINQDAFASNEVEAFVEVVLEIPLEREYVTYSIKRRWYYSEQGLSEAITVYKNEVKLTNDDLAFFQNYLFTVAPPNMFDMFFFDGEQMADFFSSNSYNSFIKSAFLTLCSFDTFEIIRKFASSYISSNEDLRESSELVGMYEKIIKDIEGLKNEIIMNDELLERLEKQLDEILNRKEALEYSFKNSGGLTQKEKEKLLKRLKAYEKTKNECNVRIRTFLENMMPFYIAKGLAIDIQAQLKEEADIQKYIALQEKLNSEQVNEIVINTLNNKKINRNIDKKVLANELLSAIQSAVKPNKDIDNYTFLHDLSKEQYEIVNSVLSYLSKFSDDEMLETIKLKEQAARKSISINKKLRESLPETDASTYSSEFKDITEAEFVTKREIEVSMEKKSDLIEQLSRKNTEKNNALNQLKTNAITSNIYNLTNKISNIMEKIVLELSKNRFREIESIMLDIMKKIMRKDNFIDLVELDENFNISIYKKQKYTASDLKNIVKNLGYDELEKRIGGSGLNQILNEFGFESLPKLKKSFKKTGDQVDLFEGKDVGLYTKIEINQMSKGEKQIFILALYYAIVKVSGKDLPFIIDTPYARIDTEHRDQISIEYFPSISNQVIILSTDEEVTSTYYNILKPHIVKEYLLKYDEQKSKTTVDPGYFF